MATVNLNMNADDVMEQMKQMNAYLKQMAEGSKKVGDEGERAAKKQETAWEKTKDMAGKVIGNYNNIKGIVTDLAEVYNEAYKRQAQWNGLMASDAYKKYADQINNISDASGGLTDAYSNVASLQKLFASNVELDGQKLEQLTAIATAYANQMGVDVTEALQRFSETIAEGSTSKLEDLGIYMDSEEAVLNYAIAHGIASKEIDDTTKKQIILNELLKLQPPNMQNNTNSIQQLTATTRQFKQNIDELIVGLGDTVGQGLMWLLNENAKGSEYWGGKIYDLVHIFDEVPEVIEGDVVPSVFALSGSVTGFADSIKKVQDELQNLGKSGIMAFKFIMEENKEAVKKHSEALRQERIKAYEEEKHAQILYNDEMEQLMEDLQTAIENKADRDLEKHKKKALDKAAFDAKVKETEIKNEVDKKERARILAREEILFENQIFNQKKDALKSFNDGRLVKMGLTTEEIKSMSQEEIEAKIKNEKEYYDAADRMANMGIQKSAQFTSMLINDVLLGEKEFRKEMVGDFIKGIGDQMVADGTFHIFAGTAKAWAGNKMGWLEAKAGAVEVGAGITMGATAKAIGTTSGDSESKSKETAAADRNSTKGDQKQKMDVYLYPDEKQWLRSLNKSNNKLGVQRGK